MKHSIRNDQIKLYSHISLTTGMAVRKLGASLIVLVGFILMAGCAPQDKPAQNEKADAFLEAIRPYCGKAFQGKLVSTDEVDANFSKSTLIMHIRDCEKDVIRIPFHVDNDRSRTWVISKTDTGLKLEHDHRHEDGSEDRVSLYGGDTKENISSTRANFPANDYSKTLFLNEGLDVSVNNLWAVEINSDKSFIYELSRPNRLFRVQFDLTAPVEVPPAAWGYDGGL